MVEHSNEAYFVDGSYGKLTELTHAQSKFASVLGRQTEFSSIVSGSVNFSKYYEELVRDDKSFLGNLINEASQLLAMRPPEAFSFGFHLLGDIESLLLLFSIQNRCGCHQFVVQHKNALDRGDKDEMEEALDEHPRYCQLLFFSTLSMYSKFDRLSKLKKLHPDAKERYLTWRNCALHVFQELQPTSFWDFCQHSNETPQTFLDGGGIPEIKKRMTQVMKFFSDSSQASLFLYMSSDAMKNVLDENMRNIIGQSKILLHLQPQYIKSNVAQRVYKNPDNVKSIEAADKTDTTQWALKCKTFEDAVKGASVLDLSFGEDVSDYMEKVKDKYVISDPPKEDGVGEDSDEGSQKGKKEEANDPKDESDTVEAPAYGERDSPNRGRGGGGPRGRGSGPQNSGRGGKTPFD